MLFDKYFCLWHYMLSKALMFSLLIWQAANTKWYLRKWPVPWNTSLLKIYGNRKYSFCCSNYCQIFDICLFSCSWKSVCGAKHSFSSQIHALLLLFFSSSDRIVYSVFLYTLALLKGRYSDRVIFFFFL